MEKAHPMDEKGDQQTAGLRSFRRAYHGPTQLRKPEDGEKITQNESYKLSLGAVVHPPVKPDGILGHPEIGKTKEKLEQDLLMDLKIGACDLYGLKLFRVVDLKAG